MEYKEYGSKNNDIRKKATGPMNRECNQKKVKKLIDNIT